MSGILEQILADVQAIKAIVGAQQPAPAQAAQQPVVQPVEQPAAVQQPVAQFDPMTGQPIAAAAPAQRFDPLTGQPITAQPNGAVNGSGQVTEAQVMSLIEPHLDNTPLKAALSAVLASMGIARLPEARPDQLPALYGAFQQVISQHAAPAAAAATSII